MHRSGTGLETDIELGWFEEAKKTGELFSGRSQVRPNIDFGVRLLLKTLGLVENATLPPSRTLLEFSLSSVSAVTRSY